MQVKKKSPYFLFHGETALHKILKFQGETANFSEKFQGEIAEFLRENMELYRQNLKISGRNTGISWRKYWISWRNLEKFSTISPSFSQKKRQLIMEKNKKWGFFFTCTVHVLNHENNCIKSDFKEISLKLATNEKSDKAFLMTPKFSALGSLCPCAGATCI